MKKSAAILLILVLTLALLITSGCGSKAEPSDSGEPSNASDTVGASSSPSGIQGTQPAAEPSPGAEASAEPSAEESMEPSSKPSAEVSSKPSSSPKADDGKDYAALGFALLEDDGLGLIALRLSESELVYLLGEPESKSDAELWGADGLSHSNWSYTSIGMDIGMAQQPDDTEAYVFSISATAPCTLATARGVKIGSSKDDVLNAYKNEIDPDANEDTDSWITAGTVFGGIGFGIENGAVTYIFIGASAE
jgi:hypothetical protein